MFLQSPFCNGGKNAKDILRLYQLILEASPEFPDEAVEKNKIYQRLFSGQAVVQGKLEKVMAELNGLLRTFSLTRMYFAEEKQDQQTLHWAIWLRERGLAERSQQVISKWKNQREQEDKESLEVFHSDLLIAEEEHEWKSTYNKLKGDLNIPQLLERLDLYYFNYRFEISNRYLVQQKAANLPDLDGKGASLEWLLPKSALLQISKKIHDILTKENPSVEDFNHLLLVLKDNESKFSTQILSQHYTFLRNLCVILINTGNEHFVPVLHEIHKDNLLKGYLSFHNQLPTSAYLNIARVAIMTGEMTWARAFIEEYKNRLVGGDEEGFCYKLNLTQFLFDQEKYEEALSQIPETASNFHYHHMARRLELKIYYEIQSDLLLYKLDAFRKFIERTAPKIISAGLKEMNLNFLNILLQLAQSPPKDKVRSARLIDRINSKKSIAEKAWLLDKARQLR